MQSLALSKTQAEGCILKQPTVSVYYLLKSGSIWD